MVLNPHKCNFMILGGDKQTFDFICQGNKIKYSQEQQPLRKTTDNKLAKQRWLALSCLGGYHIGLARQECKNKRGE